MLLDLAKQMGDVYLEVGVSLGLTATKVEQLENDYKKTVRINFQVLRTWRDRGRSERRVDDMFHELACAFRDLELEDLHIIVRNG